MHGKLTALALAAVATLGTTAALRAGEPQENQVQQRRVIVHAAPGHEAAAALPDPSQIPGDHLKVEDLASYAPGESRSYTTEGGAEVTITRAEKGERYTLRAGEKEIELGGDPAELALAGGAGEGKRVIIRHEVKSKDGAEEVEEEKIVGGPGLDILTAAGDGPPPLVVEIVGEKDGKPMRQVVVLKTVEKVETN
jgi:hypothetical protein